MSEEDYTRAKGTFLSETRRLARLGLAVIVPVKFTILTHSWRLLEKHHIYKADALQIASAKYFNATKFLAADKKLKSSLRWEAKQHLPRVTEQTYDSSAPSRCYPLRSTATSTSLKVVAEPRV
jgi:hypothetical protein